MKGSVAETLNAFWDLARSIEDVNFNFGALPPDVASGLQRVRDYADRSLDDLVPVSESMPAVRGSLIRAKRPLTDEEIQSLSGIGDYSGRDSVIEGRMVTKEDPGFEFMKHDIALHDMNGYNKIWNLESLKEDGFQIFFLPDSYLDIPKVFSYDLGFGKTLEKCATRFGVDCWKITDGASMVFVKRGGWERGEWEFEPSPSNRSDDFLARARFFSIQEAMDTYKGYLARAILQELTLRLRK